eukprot:scaffold63954_cov23-Tisochrysis_lutea.AAC.3
MSKLWAHQFDAAETREPDCILPRGACRVVQYINCDRPRTPVNSLLLTLFRLGRRGLGASVSCRQLSGRGRFAAASPVAEGGRELLLRTTPKSTRLRPDSLVGSWIGARCAPPPRAEAAIPGENSSGARARLDNDCEPRIPCFLLGSDEVGRADGEDTVGAGPAIRSKLADEGRRGGAGGRGIGSDSLSSCCKDGMVAACREGEALGPSGEPPVPK